MEQQKSKKDGAAKRGRNPNPYGRARTLDNRLRRMETEGRKCGRKLRKLIGRGDIKFGSQRHQHLATHVFHLMEGVRPVPPRDPDARKRRMTEAERRQTSLVKQLENGLKLPTARASDSFATITRLYQKLGKTTEAVERVEADLTAAAARFAGRELSKELLDAIETGIFVSTSPEVLDKLKTGLDDITACFRVGGLPKEAEEFLKKIAAAVKEGKISEAPAETDEPPEPSDLADAASEAPAAPAAQ